MSNGTDMARALLDAVIEDAEQPNTPPSSADRPLRLAVIDPSYSGVGNPKVTFEGESTMTVKGYPFLEATPVAGSRVALAPVGRGYVILGAAGLTGAYAALAARVTALEAAAIKRLIVHDQKTANTPGGGFTSGSFAKRDLNTVILNTITGATLTSSVISLPAGTYLARGSAPAFYVNQHKAKLRDTTNGVDLVNGSSEYSPTALADGFQTRSVIEGYFVLAGTCNVELQHRVTTTRGTNGAGVANNLGVPEVYSVLSIDKIA